ncbi:hypothetical protein [Photobacterium minamisatsumaniensis]|uniref:hypothetical protein n=1 Tax=Photobacterium minamisatsumaniensis TaxID=2910233 RepID=UPI003D102A43
MICSKTVSEIKGVLIHLLDAQKVHHGTVKKYDVDEVVERIVDLSRHGTSSPGFERSVFGLLQLHFSELPPSSILFKASVNIIADKIRCDKYIQRYYRIDFAS